jgi:hypothetical protein
MKCAVKSIGDTDDLTEIERIEVILIRIGPDREGGRERHPGLAGDLQ